jgi:hypothetical protein
MTKAETSRASERRESVLVAIDHHWPGVAARNRYTAHETTRLHMPALWLSVEMKSP